MEPADAPLKSRIMSVRLIQISFCQICEIVERAISICRSSRSAAVDKHGAAQNKGKPAASSGIFSPLQ